MFKQNLKYFLWIILFFLVFILFNTWKNESYLSDNIKDDLKSDSFLKDNNDFNIIDANNNIVVKTNLVTVKISSETGDINYVSLNNFFKNLSSDNNIIILDKSENRNYYVQTGIVFNDISFDKFNFGKLSNFSYTLNSDESKISVILKYNFNDVFVYKVYDFKNYSYEIDLNLYVYNKDINDLIFRHYGFIKYKNFVSDSSFLTSNLNSYEGGALFTSDKPYTKIAFDKISNNSYNTTVIGGWIAFLERYFLSVLIPDVGEYLYFAEKLNDYFYIYKYLSSTDFRLSSSDVIHFNSTLYVGPKNSCFINNLSKGIELVIDYGIFWPIADPIFFLLSFINKFLENWGFSIIFVTFLIKLLFFNLSSISYKSIGNIKKLQPRLELLKEQYKDDKPKFSQALMDLYKKENVNPLSGCLPVLIQIPVFISLYYVILESIELRHSPFIFWIQDLSSKDPYYILPVVMSITMYIQQKMNPPVQDQLQAKVMLFLPVIFLFLFLQFPSGLIIYWIMNNILSIIQQWIITRQ